MLSWHSVHALINKGLLNKHDWGMFIFLCWLLGKRVMLMNRSCSHQQPKAKFHTNFSLCFFGSSHRRAAAVRITTADCLDGFTVFSSLSLNKSQAPRVYTETGFACCDRSSLLVLHPMFAKRSKIHILCKNTLQSLSEDDMRPSSDCSRLQCRQKVNTFGKYLLDLSDEASY